MYQNTYSKLNDNVYYPMPMLLIFTILCQCIPNIINKEWSQAKRKSCCLFFLINISLCFKINQIARLDDILYFISKIYIKDENWQQCQKHEALIENVSESYLSLNIKKKDYLIKKEIYNKIQVVACATHFKLIQGCQIKQQAMYYDFVIGHILDI